MTGDFPIVCCCACSRCLAGDCCLLPQRTWTPLVWPYLAPPIFQGTTTTIYLGQGFTCSKCGGSDIGAEWHEDDRPGKNKICGWNQQYDEGTKGEHIHRTCRTCRYSWKTPVADAK